MSRITEGTQGKSRTFLIINSRETENHADRESLHTLPQVLRDQERILRRVADALKGHSPLAVERQLNVLVQQQRITLLEAWIVQMFLLKTRPLS